MKNRRKTRRFARNTPEPQCKSYARLTIRREEEGPGIVLPVPRRDLVVYITGSAVARYQLHAEVSLPDSEGAGGGVTSDFSNPQAEGGAAGISRSPKHGIGKEVDLPAAGGGRLLHKVKVRGDGATVRTASGRCLNVDGDLNACLRPVARILTKQLDEAI